MGKGIAKILGNVGKDVLIRQGAAALVAAVQHYNRLVLAGEVEKARAAIKVEFAKNRQVAERIYARYRDDMEPEVRGIYEEIMGGTQEDD